jgi:hypothetical protein
MRILSFIVLALAAVAVWYYLSSSYHPVSHNVNDRSTIEYWMTHADDRTLMVGYCSHHPEEQGTRDCSLAVAAQKQIDSGARSGSGNGAADQNTGAAADQLEAQKDANKLP